MSPLVYLRRPWLWLPVSGLIAVVLTGLLIWHFWPEQKHGPAVVVVTYYPGLPASSVERTITNRIERWVNQGPGCTQITSRSIAGVSIVEVHFRDDIDPGEALQTVNTLALGALPVLPPNTLPPVVLPFQPNQTHPLGVLVVTNLDAAQLTEIARIDVRNALSAVPGLVAPVVNGGKERTVSILLDPTKLESHGISPRNVCDALRDGNVSVKPATTYFGANQILIDTSGAGVSIEELNNLPIRTGDGSTIHLRDIGMAEDTVAVPTQVIRFNGRQVVAVPIFNQAGSKASRIQKQLIEKLPEIESRLPQGTKLEFLPLSDDELLTIYVRAPSNLRLEETEKRIAEFEQFLMREIPESDRAGILSEIGLDPDWSAVYTSNAGPQDCTIHAQLSSGAKINTETYAARLRELFRQEAKFADLQSRFNANGDTPILVRVEGGTPEKLEGAAKQVRDKLAGVLVAADVQVIQRNDATYLAVDVDRTKAAEVGLTVDDVLQQAAAAAGVPLLVPIGPSLHRTQGDRYTALLQCPNRDKRLQDMLNIPAVGSKATEPIGLSSLVTVQVRQDAVEVQHINLKRVCEVSINVGGRSRSGVAKEIDRILREFQSPEGITIQRVGALPGH
jgi:multidrug efflux pump subunit AcrB